MSDGWRGYLGSISRIATRVVAVSLGLAAAISGIGWLLGWRAVRQYVNALSVVGMACLVVAFLTVGGHWTITRGPNYVLSESVSQADGAERTRRRVNDLTRTYGGSILAAMVGAVLIALGLLLYAVAG